MVGPDLIMAILCIMKLTMHRFIESSNLLDIMLVQLTIYKACGRPRLDYGDIMYDEAYNASFYRELESTRYNACSAIAGAIKGSSKENLY